MYLHPGIHMCQHPIPVNSTLHFNTNKINPLRYELKYFKHKLAYSVRHVMTSPSLKV